MRLDKQTCDWHNKKCDSLYVTQDISKGACQAAGNAVALIRGKINPVATNNVASRIFPVKNGCKCLILRSRSRINSWNSQHSQGMSAVRGLCYHLIQEIGHCSKDSGS